MRRRHSVMRIRVAEDDVIIFGKSLPLSALIVKTCHRTDQQVWRPRCRLVVRHQLSLDIATMATATATATAGNEKSHGYGGKRKKGNTRV